jgi:uncharacterized membrane protein
METTVAAIIAVTINIIVSILNHIYCKRSPQLKAYYETETKGKTKEVLSFILAAAFNVLTYWLVLFQEGFWNMIGWILLISDIFTMMIFTAILEFLIKLK